MTDILDSSNPNLSVRQNYSKNVFIIQMSEQERNTRWLTPSDNRLRHFWEVQNLSQRNIEEEMCQTSVFGGQTQKLPLVSEDQVPLKLVAGTRCNRRWWKLSCEVPVQGNMFYSLCPEPLMTDSHHCGPSGYAWVCLALRAQEGFPPTSSAHQHHGYPVWEAMNG